MSLGIMPVSSILIGSSSSHNDEMEDEVASSRPNQCMYVLQIKRNIYDFLFCINNITILLKKVAQVHKNYTMGISQLSSQVTIVNQI